MKNSKKLKFSKLIVSAVIALNILFTIGVFIVFCITGNEPNALVVAWFAWTTGELWMLADLKSREV
ncbi:MAG: hypothetical protein MJ232_02765 [archaeon]|nr:hypothetical protein [archaeon]